MNLDLRASRVLFGFTLGAGLLGACTDPELDAPTVTTSGSARIIRAQSGTLTARSGAARDAIVKQYLSGRGVGAQLELVATSNAREGITHVTLDQRVDGMRVVGAYVKAALDDAGRLVQVIEATAPVPTTLARAAASERDALGATLTHLGFAPGVPATVGTSGNVTRFARTAELDREPTVERVAYVDPDSGHVRAGFQVETWSVLGNQLNHTIVDANGRVVSTELRTNNDRYNVFVEDPLKGAQAIVSGPGAGNAESPAGWLGTGNQLSALISGNNARAYLDVDANNAADAGGTAVTSGDFLTAVDLASAPSTASNRDVAVQNLFYLNNVVHDVLYRHGFDEAAGNFQVNNFGNGGNGNDPVNAEAQDGGGTDNANFATPSDGSSPRMQMYLWSGAGPNALVNVSAPSAATFGGWESAFGPRLTEAGTSHASLVAVGLACTSVTGLAGKIAIIDRGECDFVKKVLNVQSAGAVGAIIVNNVAGDDGFGPGGSSRRVKIPSLMLGNTSGTQLKGIAGAVAGLAKHPTPPLMVDASLDADIVYHEYGHGLTWRMIGSMGGEMSGAIGEGASDVVAFLINGDDVVAEYSASSARGIRRFPYAESTQTYADVDGGEVHNDGEIYAAAMWSVLENYLAAGLTADDVLGDFVGGMNYTPASPTFEAMRDGMLQQAAGSGRECLIWRGFAAHGIGVGATATVSRRGTIQSITPSTTVPTSCQ